MYDRSLTVYSLTAPPPPVHVKWLWLYTDMDEQVGGIQRDYNIIIIHPTDETARGTLPAALRVRGLGSEAASRENIGSLLRVSQLVTTMSDDIGEVPGAWDI